MAEQFPRSFGKYVLLKSLARGGMGEIYLAAGGQIGGLNKLCVIKKVITEKTEPAKVNRFLDEAKVVLRLSHANLVSTFDAGEVDGELYIAMELVEGKDLREIWNRCVRTRTRIPVDVALVVVREIARALAYVHSYGDLRLVHRDVAPPNILLSYFGEVKLTDFGLARSILKQEHTAPGVVFGRASYLAPEQARGEVADARTDVYSLGIVLWELLTGQPYLQLSGLDPVTSLSLVRNPRTQPPSTRAPWIAPELDAIVLKALAADRAVRFQSAEEMRRALADAMTRISPRADAEKIAEFLRGLYRDVLPEEAAERERLLADTVPRFRGERVPERNTPRTTVAASGRMTDGGPPAGAAVETALPGKPAMASADGAAGAPTVEAPAAGAEVFQMVEAPRESLAVSAQRARGSGRPAGDDGDTSGADVPTNRWSRGADGGGKTFVGRILDGRYRIERRIGEGGMGTIYAAADTQGTATVAVKILHRILADEEPLVERFRREARAASRVEHPHIVGIFDWGTTEEGCAYSVMEYLEGQDLGDLLVRERRLHPLRAVHIGKQVCRALEAVHQAGIIHRDLKPENIFLVARDGDADFVKLLDFGIAHSLHEASSRLTNPGMAMGTPEYMAPEQALGSPAERRTDVYALGALLYEMVIGEPPFKADSQSTILEYKRQPLQSLRVQRSEIPAALDELIREALSSDPLRRPQTMAAFEEALAAVDQGPAPEAAANDVAPAASGAASAGGSPPPPPLEDLLEEAFAHTPREAASATAIRRTTPAPNRRVTPAPPVPLAAALPSWFPPVPDLPSGAAEDYPQLADADADAGAAGAPDDPYDEQTIADRVVDPIVDSLLQAEAPASGSADLSFPSAPGWSARLARPGFVAAAAAVLVIGGIALVWSAKRRPAGSPVPAIASVGELAAKNMPTVVPVSVPVSPPSDNSTSPTLPSPSPAASSSSRPAALTDQGGTRSGAAGPATGAGSGPQVVPMLPGVRARAALMAGDPDTAVVVLRSVLAKGDASARPLLADALVASGWNDTRTFRWNTAARKAREALSLADSGGSSHGAHALLGESLYALHDFSGALAEFNKALEDSPRDARLKRRVIRSRRQMRRSGDEAFDLSAAITQPAAQ